MSRPNIIIVTTDQQRTDSLSCYGSKFTHTPNLDRMASEGVLMERAYCTNPVCTPSRVSIFSGQQVSRHGAWNVGTSCAEDLQLISHRVRAEGYATHYVGKAHFQAFGGPEEKSMENHTAWRERYADWTGPYYGFDEVELSLGHGTWGVAGHYGLWAEQQCSAEPLKALNKSHPVNDSRCGGEGYEWDLPTRYHSSVWTAERTIEFLRKQTGDMPFLLAVGFQDPHHPHQIPKDFDDRVDPRDVPSPNYQQGELDDKPQYFRDARDGRLEGSQIRGEFPVAGQGKGYDYSTVSDNDARTNRAYYHSMVKLIDREMGRILDCLAETGLDENTLIIFTTDHGELLGDHGLWLKGPFLYEQLVRVPTIIRWPAGIPGGRVESGLFSLVDIVPTALAAAGIESDEHIDGINALPLLRGEGQIRNDVLVECIDDPVGARLKALVTDDRKLVWHCGETLGELYDLEKDPGEIQNLWNSPDYADDKSKMLSRIMEYVEPNEARVERYAYA